MKIIPINIWDDYSEENLQTYMYVEDTYISHEIRKESLEKVLNYINQNLHLDGVDFNLFYYDSRTKYPQLDEIYQFERWEVRIKNLCHERRIILVDDLSSAKLFFNDIPFKIYSES